MAKARNYTGLCNKYFPGRVAKFMREGMATPQGETWVTRTGIGQFFAVEGQTIPTVSEMRANEASWDSFEAQMIADAPKAEVENQLRNDPAMKAQVALQAQAQGKTVDEVITEIVAEV